jgi:hypothetical protein
MGSEGVPGGAPDKWNEAVTCMRPAAEAEDEEGEDGR